MNMNNKLDNGVNISNNDVKSNNIVSNNTVNDNMVNNTMVANSIINDDIKDLIVKNRDDITYNGYISNIKSKKVITVNNGWNDKKEKIIKGWIDENKIYSWLLNEESKRYEKFDNILAIPLIILTASTGIASLASTTLNEKEIKIFNIIAGIIIILIGIISMVLHRYEFGKTSQLLSLTSKKYSTMSNDFNLILGEDINERINGTQYIREKNKERNDLYENTPSISKSTWNILANNIKKGRLLPIATSDLLNDIVNKTIKTYNLSNNDIESESSLEIENNNDTIINIDMINTINESELDVNTNNIKLSDVSKSSDISKPKKDNPKKDSDLRKEILNNLIKSRSFVNTI